MVFIMVMLEAAMRNVRAVTGESDAAMRVMVWLGRMMCLLLKLVALKPGRDSECDDFFDPHELMSCASNTDGEEITRVENSVKISTPTRGEFYDAWEGKSSASDVLAAFQVRCRGNNAPIAQDHMDHSTTVFTWKRTTSSISSSSRNPLVTSAKDDASDSPLGQSTATAIANVNLWLGDGEFAPN